jgi:hypothetical protein
MGRPRKIPIECKGTPIERVLFPKELEILHRKISERMGNLRDATLRIGIDKGIEDHIRRFVDEIELYTKVERLLKQ